MIQIIDQHTEHYAVLALILGVGLAGLTWFRNDQFIQQLIVWVLAGLYVGWGVIHHVARRDLTGTVFVEYVLMAFLAALLIQSVIVNR